uniref:Uncharacterized protein n=1 Tax=Aegilops tauschii subsp. strangulata TaxID=200361 RepID=A0A453NLN4_AEGTS
MSNDSLVTSRIVGDVLDPFRSTVDLTVLYDGRFVINGMEFRSPAVSGKPSVEIGGDDISVTYTLVMVDPDAPNPSNPTLREYLHWIARFIVSTARYRSNIS